MCLRSIHTVYLLRNNSTIIVNIIIVSYLWCLICVGSVQFWIFIIIIFPLTKLSGVRYFLTNILFYHRISLNRLKKQLNDAHIVDLLIVSSHSHTLILHAQSDVSKYRHSNTPFFHYPATQCLLKWNHTYLLLEFLFHILLGRLFF